MCPRTCAMTCGMNDMYVPLNHIHMCPLRLTLMPLIRPQSLNILHLLYIPNWTPPPPPPPHQQTNMPPLCYSNYARCHKVESTLNSDMTSSAATTTSTSRKHFHLYRLFLFITIIRIASLPCPFSSLEGFFGCIHIHLNPHITEWIGVKVKLSFITIHSNTHGLRWIQVHRNNAWFGNGNSNLMELFSKMSSSKSDMSSSSESQRSSSSSSPSS